MDYTLLITTILSSAGVFSLIQFLVTRHDKNNKRIKNIESKLDYLVEEGKKNELATTRLQLIWLVETHPDNEDAILSTAQRYFVELDGNGEAWAVFNKWAQLKKLDTTWYQMLITKERSQNGTN